MKITIIQVGKSKERYSQQAEAEYLKRLSPFAKINIITLKESSAPNSTAAGHLISKNKEGEEILKNISAHGGRRGQSAQSGRSVQGGQIGQSFIICLDQHGKSLTSVQFSDFIKEQKDFGGADLTFIIGGPYGLSEEVLAKAKLKLSFSAFTFTHEMIRVLLLEQIYRSFTIIAGKSYHY